MSQQEGGGGMFSVRRTREVSRIQNKVFAFRILTYDMIDTRARQSQCLRDPNASISDEAIYLEFESPTTSTTYNTSCTNSQWIAYVTCAWPTRAAKLQPLIVR